MQYRMEYERIFKLSRSPKLMKSRLFQKPGFIVYHIKMNICCQICGFFFHNPFLIRNPLIFSSLELGFYKISKSLVAYRISKKFLPEYNSHLNCCSFPSFSALDPLHTSSWTSHSFTGKLKCSRLTFSSKFLCNFLCKRITWNMQSNSNFGDQIFPYIHLFHSNPSSFLFQFEISVVRRYMVQQFRIVVYPPKLNQIIFFKLAGYE